MSVEARGQAPNLPIEIEQSWQTVATTILGGAEGGVVDGITERLTGSNQVPESWASTAHATLTSGDYSGMGIVGHSEETGHLTVFKSTDRLKVAEVTYPFGSEVQQDARRHRAVVAFGIAVRHLVQLGDQPSEVIPIVLVENSEK